MDTTGEDPVVRAELEARLETEGLASLLAELRSLAPSAYARVDRANHRRVIRAIERARRGRRCAAARTRGLPGAGGLAGASASTRGGHAQAIEARVRDQFRDGLLDEAADLRDRYGEELVPFGAMGYREAFDVLAGRRSLEAAIRRTVERTRAYASRQRTWFKAEADIHWIASGPASSPSLQLAAALDHVRTALGR